MIYKLCHSGVKGMKWGVRRYQNKDGSLTPAGEKRYSRDKLENKKVREANPSKWVKEDLERTKRLSDASNDMVGKLKNANDSSMRSTKKAKLDLSNMTEQQMRNEINRALLERQYNDMFAPQKSKRGREYVGKVLEGIGTTLAIGSSALGIALAIKELKG